MGLEPLRAGESAREPVPLYVDLDGTLIRTDLLLESALRLVVRNPLYLFAIPAWLLRGKAVLKHEIAQRVSLEAVRLPYNTAFLEWLRAQALSGRELVLASASDRRYVAAVAGHVGLFTDVLGSRPGQNLAGAGKLAAIKLHAKGRSFDYAGNAKPDLQVWQMARRAIVVNPGHGVTTAVRRVAEVEAVFDDLPRGLRVWLKAVRIHQWLKNLLIGVPLITSFRFTEPHAVKVALAAFVAFGLVASATYLANDLVDLDADRQHPRKRFHPLASGAIRIMPAIFVLVTMLVGGLALSAAISLPFLGALAVYVATTLAYSLWLKSLVFVDVLCLAILYTWRIVAGAIAINVELSNWLAAFSMFVFLSLALVKRCAELIRLAAARDVSTKTRDYRVTDITALTAMGTAAGYLSVLVLALFIDAPSTAGRYANPRLLWLLCPLLLYWVSRLWVKTARGEMPDDPIIYAATDRASWVVLAGFCIVTLVAK